MSDYADYLQAVADLKADLEKCGSFPPVLFRTANCPISPNCYRHQPSEPLTWVHYGCNGNLYLLDTGELECQDCLQKKGLLDWKLRCSGEDRGQYHHGQDEFQPLKLSNVRYYMLNASRFLYSGETPSVHLSYAQGTEKRRWREKILRQMELQQLVKDQYCK